MTNRFVKNKHTGEICEVKKVEVIRGLTVYIFPNGDRITLRANRKLSPNYTINFSEPPFPE